MLEVYERLGLNCDAKEFERVELNHEQRSKGRLRTVSVEGSDVGLFLERGSPLQVGEFLRSRCGKTLRVDGAIEEVTVARCDDWETFSRACYHLGNRHVKVQIESRSLLILPDHVLEEMLTGLGMTVSLDRQVFIPETGAYSHGHSHGHTHSHSNNPGQSRRHDHSHGHSHGEDSGGARIHDAAFEKGHGHTH